MLSCEIMHCPSNALSFEYQQNPFVVLFTDEKPQHCTAATRTPSFSPRSMPEWKPNRFSSPTVQIKVRGGLCEFSGSWGIRLEDYLPVCVMEAKSCPVAPCSHWVWPWSAATLQAYAPEIPWTQVAKYSPHETHPTLDETSASADQTLVQGLTWWCAAAARRVPRRRVCRDEIAMFGCVGYESIRYRRIYINIYIYVLYIYILYIHVHVYGKIWGPHCDLTGLMVSRRNYPKIALFFSGHWIIIVIIYNIYIYIRIHM